jgi:hypothetical protein
MREQEMRRRVFRFLKARMRNMIMPATVGLGFAVGGCASEGNTSLESGPVQDSAASDVPVYSAPIPDGSLPWADSGAAGQDASSGTPNAKSDAIANLPPDAINSDAASVDSSQAGVADVAPSLDQRVAIDGDGIDGGSVDATLARDARDDLGGIVTKYIAQIPDASPDSGGVAPLYQAQVPDAGTDAGMVVRYMAPTPDSGIAVRYMAQMPDGGPVPLYIAPQQS